jgi:hypothetical protein
VKSIGENSISFVYKKDINELLKILSKYKLVSLRINDIKLEDIFVEYYSQQASQKLGDVVAGDFEKKEDK